MNTASILCVCVCVCVCSGESYAGIYVPTLVDYISKHNNQPSNMINLKGFMVRVRVGGARYFSVGGARVL